MENTMSAMERFVLERAVAAKVFPSLSDAYQSNLGNVDQFGITMTKIELVRYAVLSAISHGEPYKHGKLAKDVFGG